MNTHEAPESTMASTDRAALPLLTTALRTRYASGSAIGEAEGMTKGEAVRVRSESIMLDDGCTYAAELILFPTHPVPPFEQRTLPPPDMPPSNDLPPHTQYTQTPLDPVRHFLLQ